MIKSLNSYDYTEMRQKVLAFTLFSKRKPWNCSRRFDADYVQILTNPDRLKFAVGMAKICGTFGDAQILFADYVNKINKRGKSQKRVIIVTEKNFYKQDPSNYSVKKSELSLEHIEAVSMSPLKDTFVVVHARAPYRDLVLDLGINGEERLSEFVVVLSYQVNLLTGNVIKVQFKNSIPYNNSRSKKNPGSDSMLTFLEIKGDDTFPINSCQFKKLRDNIHVVHYR